MATGTGTERRNRSSGEKVKDFIMSNIFILLMILALVIGVVVGLTVRRLDGWEYWQKRKIFYLKFPGDLLLNMLKMLIIPLIVSSLVSSLAALDSRASGRMGLRAVVYYLTTTFCAVVIGIVLVLAIRPGYKGGAIEKSGKTKEQEPLEALFDLIRNCFPDNLIESAFRKASYVLVLGMTALMTEEDPRCPSVHYLITSGHLGRTTDLPQASWMASSHEEFNAPIEVRMQTTEVRDYNVTEEVGNTTILLKTVDDPKVVKSEGMNILGIVVFSIFFGVMCSKMGPAGKPLLDFFEALHVATMKLTMLVIWYSPIGIVFLVATKLIEMKDPTVVFVQLGYYMITVLAGLAVHGFIVLPLVYFVAVRRNPFVFMYNMLKAILTAWGTASSSATLPVTMECLEHRNKVDIRVAKFVAPIGATVNMDGTALYEAVAAIFIAQVNGITLSVGEVITISLTATAAAIGAAGIPSAGLVTMAIVLTAVGLPIDDIRLIYAIDWFLDRFRTAINVLGDSYGAGIVEKLSKGDLDRFEEEYLHNLGSEGTGSTDDIIPPKEKEGGMGNPVFTREVEINVGERL